MLLRFPDLRASEQLNFAGFRLIEASREDRSDNEPAQIFVTDHGGFTCCDQRHLREVEECGQSQRYDKDCGGLIMFIPATSGQPELLLA